MAEYSPKSDEQFSGLDMRSLIGAPLQAAADAYKALADSTQEFIEKIEAQNPSTKSFMFEHVPNSIK